MVDQPLGGTDTFDGRQVCLRGSINVNRFNRRTLGARGSGTLANAGTPRKMSKVLYAIAVTALASGCGGTDYRAVEGRTMGTSYRILARCPETLDAGRIDTVLASVNASMSNWDKDSEISRFNASAVGEWTTLSPPLAEVMRTALTLSAMSEGAFDVSVGALVDAWGFGPAPARAFPDDVQVEMALGRTGFRHLELDGSRLRKTVDVSIDLSAIAKGYGVDAMAATVADQGCADYLAEIGGEVRVRGKNPEGRPWRLAIEVPNTSGVAHRVVTLSEGAIATSGDYRNFFERDGKRYSHTIDPRLGMPVTHALASASVVHASAMWADGYATLIAVLGPEAGLTFAASNDLAAYLLVRGEDGLETRATPAMASLLASGG